MFVIKRNGATCFMLLSIAMNLRSVSFKAHGYNWTYILKTRRLENHGFKMLSAYWEMLGILFWFV
jgi:hypothetical protein